MIAGGGLQIFFFHEEIELTGRTFERDIGGIDFDVENRVLMWSDRINTHLKIILTFRLS